MTTASLVMVLEAMLTVSWMGAILKISGLSLSSQVFLLPALILEPSQGLRYLCCGGCGTVLCRTSAAFRRLPLNLKSPWFSQS